MRPGGEVPYIPTPLMIFGTSEIFGVRFAAMYVAFCKRKTVCWPILRGLGSLMEFWVSFKGPGLSIIWGGKRCAGV